MKSQESGRETDGRDAPVVREAAHGGFADLQDACQLSRGQKLFARCGCGIFLRFMCG